MLHDRDIVIVSDDYHGLPTSAIHLSRRLAKRNRVFWMNAVGRLPRPSLADARKVVNAVGGMMGRRRRAGTEGTDVAVSTPAMVPWFGRPGRWFNAWSFGRAYQRLGLRDPILITTFPFTADFVRAAPADLKVYYCVDDFLGYPGVDHRRWERMESDLLDNVDAVVVTSHELGRTRRRPVPTLHLPHGVDFDHYQQAFATPRPEAERPVVGFFGLIGEWFDVGLVDHLAMSFPDVSFVLVGRVGVDVSALERRPNVRLHGWVPYSELPQVARCFDVGLIPYVQNRFTHSINPLKLLEYFALGLPVVATRLPELETVSGPVHLAETPEEFREQLRTVLKTGPAAWSDEAIAAARDGTWDRRAEQLSEFLVGLLADADHGRSLRRPACRP